jgi:KDO2-lipid IV(A) lauroyltransferase
MIYWLTRVLCWAAGRTPRRPRLWLGGALCELVYLLWASKRRITIANMAQVLGLPANDARVRWTARRSWRNYGRYVADFFYLPNASVASIAARLRDTASPPGWRAMLDRARAGGRALLVPTAHFGNWDVAGVMVGSHIPLHVIAETFADPRQNELIQRQRAALGMTVIPMERTPRRILRVLQAGGAVATPVDRPMPPGEGVPVQFFGRRCYVPGGIAQLALKTDAAIVPGFVYYDEAYSPAYYGYAAEPIFPHPTGDRAADVIALTQRIYDAIEAHVRAHPTQWYMFRAFWPAVEQASAPTRETVPTEAGDSFGGKDLVRTDG